MRSQTMILLLCLLGQLPGAATFAPHGTTARPTPQNKRISYRTAGQLDMLPSFLGSNLGKTEYSSVPHSPREKNRKKEWTLEREVLRLDSLGTYVLVSILTATSSRASLEDTIDASAGTMLGMVHTLLTVTSTLSIFSGVYATIVFSLCILYGKTALGMQRDRVYDYLLEKTYPQRLRGFQALLFSLFTFLIENGLVAMEKVPEDILPVVFVTSTVFTIFTAVESYHIISIASLIFRPEKGAKAGSRDEDDDDDDDDTRPLLKEVTIMVPRDADIAVVADGRTVHVHKANGGVRGEGTTPFDAL